MYTGGQGQPPVDLLVRTSGETRLSDFLLWQCATAHLVFSRALWPEFSYLHLLHALVQYQRAVPALETLRAEWGKWLAPGSVHTPATPPAVGPPSPPEGRGLRPAASRPPAHTRDWQRAE